MHGFEKKQLGIRNIWGFEIGNDPQKPQKPIRPLKARHGVVVQCSDPLRSRGWRELFEFEKAVNWVLGWAFKIESHYLYIYIYIYIFINIPLYIYIPLLYPITHTIIYIYILTFNVHDKNSKGSRESFAKPVKPAPMASLHQSLTVLPIGKPYPPVR